QMTGADQVQTEIDVVKSDREALFIEAANFVEDITPREQTGARHRAVVARHLKLPAHARIFRRKTAKRMLRNPANAKHDACMLNGVVRINQARTNRTDFRPLHMLDHGGEPIAIDNLDVIVQEEEPRTV